MSFVAQSLPAETPDLSSCEREPIHIPGSIEANGVLLAVQEPGLAVLQVSANCEHHLSRSAESLLGARLPEVLDEPSFVALQKIVSIDLSFRRRYLNGVRVTGSGGVFDASVHRHDGLLLLELEPAAEGEESTNIHSTLADALANLEGRISLRELCQRVAVQVRSLTGFDRVMVYQFLEDDTGWVIAEDSREDLSPYLGLRYPASDIPAQARRLYLLNALRLKSDVCAPRVPLVPELNPVTGRPLDMSFCILRSMSPVHIEYLKNMGVTASMSVSITKGERLWGLIACHHMSPMIVRHPVRILCELLARVFSAHIAAAEAEDARGDAAASLQFAKDLELRFRTREQSVFSGLASEAERIASIVGAQGAAICLGSEIALGGTTPSREAVAELVKWLDRKRDEYLFQTDKLPEEYPAAQEFAETATGLLAMRVALRTNDCVLWFRPPAVRVIEWAGNPDKPVEETEAGRRISPRLSFERWKQTFGDRSEPWRQHEQDFAMSLRQVLAELLLIEKNEESVHLNTELGRSNIELDAFAYAVSHDLQEPVRTIRAYAQLLARRSAKTLDDDGRELLNTIDSGAIRMSNLITALLAYGQVGGSVKRERISVNLGDVLRWVVLNLDETIRASSAEVTYDELPNVTGDPDQLTQLLQNLIGNAIKYRRPEETPKIHVSASRAGASWRFGVHDNGQGFEESEANFIFGAFKRLHGRDVPGTGIGLALCKRIVENHGGRIWAESKGRGQGASLWFTLPQL